MMVGPFSPLKQPNPPRGTVTATVHHVQPKAYFIVHHAQADGLCGRCQQPVCSSGGLQAGGILQGWHPAGVASCRGGILQGWHPAGVASAGQQWVVTIQPVLGSARVAYHRCSSIRGHHSVLQ
eukprot:scaffold32444_cov17-Tisochrysis_lutea.AAC.2